MRNWWNKVELGIPSHQLCEKKKVQLEPLSAYHGPQITVEVNPANVSIIEGKILSAKGFMFESEPLFANKAILEDEVYPPNEKV